MVDAVVSVLLKRLLTSLLNERCRLFKLDGQFDKLEDELIYMKNLLKEACKVRRKDQSDNFKKVMGDFRDLVYDAESVIEESQLLYLKLHNEGLSNFMKYCSPQLLKFRRQIAKRLMVINKGIENVKKRMTTYLATSSAIIASKEDGADQHLRYPILIDGINIVGLENDSAKISEWIFDADRAFMVIGIVGMGGVGKTTLAKKICRSEGVKHSFDHIIFVTISQNLKLEDRLKKMLNQMKVEEEFTRGKEVEELLEMLRSELEDKKYMVVLDDVWGTDEDYWWDSLKPAFPEHNGCCIIVTTRNEGVVRAMGAIDRYIHHAKVLSVEDSWSLFAKVAFARNGGKCLNSDLESIGKEIVTRCGGLPLAIKVVGGMMLEKGDSIHEWRRMLEYLKEELAEKKKDEPIMSSLELSYDELPAYLKPCFLCFSMFPEDHLVYIYHLIWLWIGEGFVSGTNGRTAFEIGRERATELVNRCLLVEEGINVFEGELIIVRIHDLVRDMVIKIARDENFTSLDERGRPQFSLQSRRVSIFGDEIIESVRSKKVKKSAVTSKLRTLYGLDIDKEVVLSKELKLCNLRQLRSLYVCFSRNLKDHEVIVKDWLDGITSMSHLVYLKIENCILGELPESIGNLRNLQILSLWLWENLEVLPPTITKLDKLTIFEIILCESLECMPNGIWSLSDMEQLFGFLPAIARHKNASRIGQLKNLGHLRQLRINFTNPMQLEEGELNALSELQHLRDLTISFCETSAFVNHKLLPLPSLDFLWLGDYPGESTPIWLNPTTLPNLRFLRISGGRHLTCISPEFMERECGIWKIEKLCLEYLFELEEAWERLHGALPFLRIVMVSNCPKLKSFPLDVTAFNVIWRKEEDNATAGICQVEEL